MRPSCFGVLGRGERVSLEEWKPLAPVSPCRAEPPHPPRLSPQEGPGTACAPPSLSPWQQQAELIPHPSSIIPHPSSIINDPSSRIHHQLSIIPHPSSRIPHPTSTTPPPSATSCVPHPPSLTPHPVFRGINKPPIIPHLALPPSSAIPHSMSCSHIPHPASSSHIPHPASLSPNSIFPHPSPRIPCSPIPHPPSPVRPSRISHCPSRTPNPSPHTSTLPSPAPHPLPGLFLSRGEFSAALGGLILPPSGITSRCGRWEGGTPQQDPQSGMWGCGDPLTVGWRGEGADWGARDGSWGCEGHRWGLGGVPSLPGGASVLKGTPKRTQGSRRASGSRCGADLGVSEPGGVDPCLL